MSLIDISHLTFAHEGTSETLFDDVSLSIDTDWKLGCIGRNGRGKTTLMQLLMGRFEYAGTIAADVAFDYFPYAVADGRQPVEAAIAAICPDALPWEWQRELSLLQVAPEVLGRSFNTLSNGERTKILLAALFMKGQRESRYLLIDEPTNHLDSRARQVVGAYLRGKRGFLLVSHDRAFLDDCIDHVLSLNKTGMDIQQGNFSSWRVNKERQDAFEQAENRKLRKDIQRLSAAARRTADWSDSAEKTKYASQRGGEKPPDRGYVGHKAAKMMNRAKAIESRRQSAAEDKAKLLKNVETAEALKLHPLRYSGGRLAELAHVSVAYDGRTVCRDISFTVEQGDRIALCGPNGSGKSSLLRLLMGEDVPHEGAVHRAARLTVSYVPQSTDHLRGRLSDYARGNGLDESLFKAILSKLDVPRTQFDKDIADFSAGQKKKVLLACSLCQPAHLYIWDEPLNYIDVLSRMQFESLLLEYAPTLLFVEHDRQFAEHIATKMVSL